MSIPAPDPTRLAAARAHQDQLTKPMGALGRLEDIACWFAARQRGSVPARLTPAITVFAADHGVVARGVSAYPPEVTARMVENIARGGAAISVLARHIGATLTIVDVGVDADLLGMTGVVQAKVRRGSRDLASGPALERDEVDAALAAGREAARRDVATGANVLIAGDMGIGNTTAAASLICGLTHEHVDLVVGSGTGIDDEGRRRKVAIVAEAVERTSARSGADGRAWLSAVGGLEIAAITGYVLGAAESGTPIVLDGFISAAAALVARAMDERVVDWLLASHVSAELGHARALAHLGLSPLVDFRMRLGEGSGAALVIPLLDAALRLHVEMATFADARVPGRAS